MYDNEEVLICSCHNIEHQLIITYSKDCGCNCVYCYIHLAKLPFLKRLKHGLKYIFGYKSMYGDFEEFIFNPKDVKKMQRVVKYLKKCKDD